MYLDLYRVTLCMCSITFRCNQRGPNVTSNDTRNSMMETKVSNFVSTMSRTSKCNHCSKLFVKQQGFFYTVNLKNIKLYCIYRCLTQNYTYPFQNLSLGFILKIFLKFRKFEPRYSYKKYSYKKKRVIIFCRPTSSCRCLLLDSQSRHFQC